MERENQKINKKPETHFLDATRLNVTWRHLTNRSNMHTSLTRHNATYSIIFNMCACMYVFFIRHGGWSLHTCIHTYVMYVCGCLHNVPRTDSAHVLSMPRADFQPRSNTLDVCCWFWHQIRTRHLENPEIDHKIMGGSLSPALALKLFLESF